MGGCVGGEREGGHKKKGSPWLLTQHEGPKNLSSLLPPPPPLRILLLHTVAG
jgi:hypothetical protein